MMNDGIDPAAELSPGWAVEDQGQAELTLQADRQTRIEHERPLLGTPTGQRTRKYKTGVGQICLRLALGERKRAKGIGGSGGSGQLEVAIDYVGRMRQNPIGVEQGRGPLAHLRLMEPENTV